MDVKIQGVFLDSVWYNLNDGINQTYLGYIDSQSWTQILNGSVKISIFANDSFGSIVNSYVIIRKDIIKPLITIYSPSNSQEFENPPLYNISIQEPNMFKIWYTLDNGAQNNTVTEFTGVINQSVWNAFSEGPLTLKFYAEDLAGNVGESSVLITKSLQTQQPSPAIPGYNPYFLLVAIFVMLVITFRKRTKS
jgi:hypothetical protein